MAIVYAASQVIALKGYIVADMAEIASNVGMHAEASIDELFRAKKDLLRSVPGNGFCEQTGRSGINSDWCLSRLLKPLR